MNEADDMWREEREPAAEVVRRGNRLLAKVMAMPQRNIMLVTHSSLLLHTLGIAGVDASLVADGTSKVAPHPDMRSKFDNCEVRSAVLFVQH